MSQRAISPLQNLQCIGNESLLKADSLAILCSRKCPGSIIIKAFDLMQELRHTDTTVVSGFHTAVEKECLDILLKGNCRIILCPARSTENMRLCSEWKKPITEGRLLVTSPFTKTVKRITKESSAQRNDFVASLADNILILHAAPKSKTCQLAQYLSTSNKRFFTIDDPANSHLKDMGYESVNLLMKEVSSN